MKDFVIRHRLRLSIFTLLSLVPVVRAQTVLTGGTTYTTPYTAPINLQVNSGTATENGVISGTGLFTKSGAGTLTLGATNTLTGATEVAAGTLNLGNTGSLASSSSVTVDAGATLSTAAGFNFQGLNGSGTVSGNLTISGNSDSTFSGALTGNLTKTGTGTFNLTGSLSTPSGALSASIGGGTVAFGNGGAFGFPAGSTGLTLNMSGGTAVFNTTTDYTSSYTFNSGNVTYGTLGIASLNAFGTGTIIKQNTDNLLLALGNFYFAYNGSVVVNGGTLTFNLNSTLLAPSLSASTAALSIASGATAITNGGTLTALTGAGTLQTPGAVVVANTSADQFDGVITGAGSLTKSGAGTLTLTGANTYTGATTISAGALALNPTAAESLSGAVANSTVLNIGLGANLTLGGIISGSGTLNTTSGTGTLTLNGANTYTGKSTFAAGTIVMGSGSALGTGAVEVDSGATLNTGTFAFDLTRLTGTGAIKSNGSLLYASSTNATFSNAFSGSGSITKGGTSTLTLSGANSLTGTVALSGGSLVLSNLTALPTGALTFGGGSLSSTVSGLNLGNAYTISGATTFSGSNSLTLSGHGTLSGFNAITVGSGITTALTGSIGESSTSILIKQGAGTLEVDGANSYTGGTLLSAGTTRINNSSGSAFGTGAVTVSSGATLTGAGYFSGAFQNNGIYSPGNSPHESSLSSFSQGSTGELDMQIGGLTRGTQYDALDISGSASLGGTLSISLINGFVPSGGQSFDLFQWGSVTGTFATIDLPTLSSGLTWDLSRLYSSGIVAVNGTSSAVPEPTTTGLVAGLGVLGLALARRSGLRKRGA